MKRISMTLYKVLFTMLVSVLLLVACSKPHTPKPYGYFRIYMPPHTYHAFDDKTYPFRFHYSLSASIIKREQAHELYWFDLNYPQFNAQVHCSYKAIQGNLKTLSEDAHRFVYKHSIKADGIGEQAFSNNENRVFGILYDLKGNTASNLQFVLTDSSRHFLRGALYFDNVPNKDSIAPIAEYVREDMVHLMETLRWK
ncbi:MAG: gliding motility lipoprotein GldD [Porphyromonadaceae bacterium CG2_30_38_12]|nr:MAG: gliding motility lipoprotein GldD [Porphyromonadaceae bacterium CG2_30_38_12]